MSAHHACITRHADGASVPVDPREALAQSNRSIENAQSFFQDEGCDGLVHEDADDVSWIDAAHGQRLARAWAAAQQAFAAAMGIPLSGYLPQDDYFPRLPTNHPGVVGERA